MKIITFFTQGLRFGLTYLDIVIPQKRIVIIPEHSTAKATMNDVHGMNIRIVISCL